MKASVASTTPTHARQASPPNKAIPTSSGKPEMPATSKAAGKTHVASKNAAKAATPIPPANLASKMQAAAKEAAPAKSAAKPSPSSTNQEPPKTVTATKTQDALKTQAATAADVASDPVGQISAMARPANIPAPPSQPRPSQPAMAGGRPVPPSRAAAKEEHFVEGDFVVYPTHGVGKVEKINVEEIAGHRLELIHITFEENRMTLRVPVPKARSAGLRKLATRKMFDEALAVLKGRARIKRTMWSRRAQEYEAKINSGDPIAIAEVVRDLHRNAGQPDQSFSERQIYEAAMDRLAAELGALDQTDKTTAVTKLANYLKTV
jgi:CarD family transcriptional regulator, regulator of rRNA transcription